MSWPWAISSARVGTAKSGVPMNASRSAMQSGSLFEFFRLGQLLDRHGALQPREMVDEQHAVQMIHLMLQAGGQHAVGLQCLLVAVAVQILRPDAGGPFDIVPDFRHRQTAFL